MRLYCKDDGLRCGVNRQVFHGKWHVSEQAKFLGFGFTFLVDMCLFF